MKSTWLKLTVTVNIADALTKHIGNEEMNFHIGETKCYIGKGRHRLAPEVTYREHGPHYGHEIEEDGELEEEGPGDGHNGWRHDNQDENDCEYELNGEEVEEEEMETSGGYYGVM